MTAARKNPSRWWHGVLVAVLLYGVFAVLGLAVEKAKNVLPGSQVAIERPLSAAVDLCAVQLPITHGRLLKTQGEVANWREAKNGGVDIFLVKEIDGGTSCGVKAHLPPTIPETTWRPTAGERVMVCGLVVPGKRQPQMVAAWGCL